MNDINKNVMVFQLAFLHAEGVMGALERVDPTVLCESDKLRFETISLGVAALLGTLATLHAHAEGTE
jgi:hypothetical protein